MSPTIRNPKIPPTPILSRDCFTQTKLVTEIDATPITEGHRLLVVTSGRIALAHILRSIGIGSGCRVLVPTFNCSAMVQPIQALGAEPVFYRMTPDLSPDMNDLSSKCDSSVKCIIVAHYFGFSAPMNEIAEIASSNRLPLIEDCAHALFGHIDGTPLGSIGDYAFCSPWKFLPVFDGGYAFSAKHDLRSPPQTGGGFRFQAKAAFNLLERSVASGRLSGIAPLLRATQSTKMTLSGLVGSRDSMNANEAAPSSVHGDTAFEPEWMDVKMSAVSRWLSARVSYSRIISNRRANYVKYLSAFENLAGCRPLHTTLPERVVPYVFPLYLDEGERVYPKLRQLGVPAFRWEEIPDDICKYSSDYRDRLVQLPVHQELSCDETDRVVAAVRSAIDSTR